MANTPKGVEYVAPLLAVVTMAIAVPLVLRKVPPNVIYGFRTPKTLSNPQIWYVANYKGGINLIVASIAALLCWVVFILLFDRSIAAVLSTGVFVAASIVATIVSLLQLRKL